ncbi:hypothetical protein PCANC_05994 [Puccinia coronata f. sp. avenae]|uniref:Uncharacterized protein n=1 Tax=Puccinia coronata f. sp. avenae TaxID=200324 RepID=A0A2N5V1L2_9BASI|nr:hypothetical protein PCASD_05786 [Puccinia coronata f. sp. avenae]PLW53478.1 hypothetical protein PCANC_05994 [Puccinia coronata f. sp. avenae]
MPACGCPDVRLENGEVRSCSCQPCSSGNLQGCSCNKETGCACTSSVLPTEDANRCVCTASGKACSCEGCGCKDTAAVAASSGSCCS